MSDLTSPTLLKSAIERIEKLKEDQESIKSEIKSILEEAASQGFQKTIIREALRLRKMGREERLDHMAAVETYLNSLEIVSSK